MLAISRAVELPDPEVNADGFGSHGTRRAFEHDRRRDVELALAGFRVVRFTPAQVMYEPEETGRRLRALHDAQ